jgi:two-component system, chemotaxis family, protein-glutamate methylesterase/glutaminase
VKVRPLIAIGASMGGTVVLESLLARLPADTPPIVIVQHTLPHFVGPLVRQLDGVSPMRVVEAVDGGVLTRGMACVAPGGSHLVVERQGDELRTILALGPPVRFHRPSVDVLFHSLVTLPHIDLVAVLLTGMGRDGAEGLLALRRARAQTIAQDQGSSAIFGMPKEAIERGAAQHISSVDQLPSRILACVGHGRRVAVPHSA